MTALLLFGTAVLTAHPQQTETPRPSSPPKIEVKVKSLTRHDGFLPLYLNGDEGTVLAEVDGSTGFLYATGLSSGLGSNPVGLDRGQWGDTKLVQFKQVGRRVYLIEKNTRFRASSQNQAERRAVRDSFADSVFWSTDVVAQTGDRILIDLKTLLVRDAHRVESKLKGSDQGDYKFSKDLSFVALDQCKAFPKNCELNALVTFTTSKPGPLVRQTAASGNTFTLRLHHSFVKLPEPGYKVRKADPRVSSIFLTFADYSAPLDKPLEQRVIVRHRLEKKTPGPAKSEPVEPIVFYLDPGTPQPVRDALLDGARWWNAAYEAAGFINAFQVRMLPEDVDPMDVRYNVIQWVHRRTRGWSYGQSVTDPRTGEIIKGHVLLGSLRVRQDRLIMDGLTSRPHVPGGIANACGIAGAGIGDAIAMFSANVSPIDVSLARLRQLSAHEVGHTIGFRHNFAASTYADRASVMDYPAPRVKIAADGSFDLSDAYGDKIGEWDKLAVRYAYADFGEHEEQGLKQILEEADKQKYRFLSDADARPAAAANPQSNLWDNGIEPIAELEHLMKVRRLALNKLGEGDLFEGQALSELEVVLVPVYLYHRYQVDAVAKMIGGFDYDYAIAGAKRKPVTPVATASQLKALNALLQTIRPSELVIPEKLLRDLAPRAYSSASDRERFESKTSMIFDPDSAVRVAAELTVQQILQPQRMARLQAYGTEEWNMSVLVNSMSRYVLSFRGSSREQRIAEIIQHVFVRELAKLAGNESTSHPVRAAAANGLREFIRVLESRNISKAHREQLMAEARRFFERPHQTASSPQNAEPPPGSPIGQNAADRGN